MAATLQFDDIYHGLDSGKIRLGASGMAWKAFEGENSISLPVADLKWAQWLRVAKNYQLRVGLKSDRRRETFEGFLKEDYEKLSNSIKQHYGIVLETKEISLKGWNWGTTDFQGQDLAFLVSNKTTFEVQLNKVANSNIAGKTEVSLEFINSELPDTQKKKRGDELVEMRFYVPGTLTKDDDEEEEKIGASDNEETSAAQAFHDQIKERADIGQVTGEGIIVFNEVLVVTPRGRYDIDMFPSFLRLRGKTYDYKIAYTAITKLFLLPKGDDTFVQLIVGLDPPIRQGQTRYPFLVMHFSRDEEMDAELNLDEETIATKYEGKLEKKYDAPTFQVISSIFRALTGKKLIAPSGFQSRDGQHGIKCNQKATQGELYFLEKSLIFVAKQPTLVDFADIHQAIFSRVGGGMASARTFDLKIVPKTGAEVSFTSINKEEQDPVENYLKSKKVRVKTEMADDLLAAPGVSALSDDDEEMQSVASSGDEAPKPRIGGDEDEDSSEDEDFQASGSDSGSPTEPSSDEDEGPQSDASGDVEMAKATAPKKKKKDASGSTKKKKKSEPTDDAEMKDARPVKPKTKPKPASGSEGEGPARKKQRKE